MSFTSKLGRGRTLDPGGVGLTTETLPPLPDPCAPVRVDVRSWFPEPGRPMEIEIGTGKGTFLCAQAAARPDVNFLGIEVSRPFWLYAADRARRHGLTNVRLLLADAADFLHWRCPDAVARVIHLYFPDPWPKRRHHRRRIVQDRFLADVHRVLEPGGQLRLVTDHDEYWAWIDEHLARWTAGGSDAGPVFERLPFAGSAGHRELVGTNFERKYRRQGRDFHAVILRRPG